jgi:hypothetical protein
MSAKAGLKDVESLCASNRVFGCKDSQFFETGQAALEKHIKQYERRLRIAAKFVAKRCHSDSVSPRHIELAASQISLPEKKNNPGGTIGGIVLGAAAGHLISVVCSSSQISTIDLVVIVLFSIVGTFSLVKGHYSR